MLLYLSLICLSPVFIRQWCGPTSTPASTCLCLPQVQHSFGVCEEHTFCNGDTCTCTSWVSCAGLFLIPSMWEDCSLQWGCSPCLGDLSVFLLHQSPVCSSSTSWCPCWPCLWLSSPRFFCYAVPAALQTTLLVTCLCL